MLRFAAILISFIALCGPGGVTAATDSGLASEYYEDAVNQFDDGDYLAAVIQLKNALQQDPNHLAARVLFGRALLMAGDYAGAEHELRVAREANAADELTLIPLADALLLQRKFAELLKTLRPDHLDPQMKADILVRRAEAYIEVRKLDKAREALDQAARIRPDDVSATLAQAKLQVGLGDFAAAEAFADKAVALAPDQPNAWFMKGEIRRARRDLDDAINNYGKAIAIQPGHLPSRLGRAGLLIDLGRYEQSRQDIEFTRSADPEDPQAAYYHAIVLTQAGAVADARAALNDADVILRNTDPDFLRAYPPYLLLASLIAYAQGNLDEARVFAEQFIAKQPYHSGARKLLGQLLLRGDKPEQAVQVLEPTLHLASGDPELLALLGTAFMQVGKDAEAAKLLTRAVELAPDLGWIRAQRARSQIAAGRSEEAATDLEFALKLNPDDVGLGYLLARVQLENGRYDAALDAAQTLIAAHPDRPEPHDLAGIALFGRGDNAGARARFEQALSVDPSYRNAIYNLVQIDLREDNSAAAKERLRAMLDSGGSSTRPMRALARIAEGAGQFDEAIRWYEKVRVVDRDDIRIQLHLIALYVGAGQPDAAVNLARAVRAANSTTLPILQALGHAELAAGNKEAARDAFLRMVPMAQYSARDLTGIARLQLAADDTYGAATTLERALLMAGADYLPALSPLVHLEARTGRIQSAMERVKWFQKLQPEAAEGDRLEADVLMRDKRYSKAAKAYAAAFRKQPASDIALRLYLAHRNAGQQVAGLAVLEDWLATNPDDLAGQRVLGSAYIETGRYDAALRLHESLLKILPDDPMVLTNLAWLYQRNGNPDALSIAERAYGLAPEQPATISTLGWVLVQDGEPARGLALLREAYARDATAMRTRYYIAVALEALGRNDKARVELEAVLATERDSRLVAEARALFERLSGQ
ncbi:MAG: PEP-CTERM system TPR-repeat protein PrsT [Alphaproteobacteria bacterium]|nr:PEP-CTERM system TPR-repeat protein PrsT [Alphaproteobacteria bacterium]MDP6515426.1 PEP-CTERM system TPR-repeat protein PrsT [Alphaproteobacteria bacterium]